MQRSTQCTRCSAQYTTHNAINGTRCPHLQRQHVVLHVGHQLSPEAASPLKVVRVKPAPTLAQPASRVSLTVGCAIYHSLWAVLYITHCSLCSVRSCDRIDSSSSISWHTATDSHGQPRTATVRHGSPLLVSSLALLRARWYLCLLHQFIYLGHCQLQHVF